MPGTTELIIIFAMLILLFGVNKLPGLGGAIGESIKNFKKGIKSDETDNNKEISQESSQKTKEQ